MESRRLRDRAIAAIMENMGINDPEVTDIHRSFFASIRYPVLCRPLVIKYIDGGRTIADATRKFQLTRRQVEIILQNKNVEE